MGMTDFAAPALTTDSTSANTNRKASNKKTNEFDVNDFYKLFAAQMQNQDMMNPVDDSQFLAQIAQMSSIQAMEQMNQMTMTSYAFEFMGKEVIVADYDSKNNLLTSQGVVEKVALYNGKPQVFVGGKAYELSQVMEVITDSKIDPVDLIGRQVVYAEYDKDGNFVTESVKPDNTEDGKKDDVENTNKPDGSNENGDKDKPEQEEEKKIVTQTGTVEKVTYYEGKTEIYINGKAYEPAQILEILPST